MHSYLSLPKTEALPNYLLGTTNLILLKAITAVSEMQAILVEMNNIISFILLNPDR
ncbi:MAG: hypothetical protein AAF316_16265 [Cyanobacteria bacterium P01_A01_bin.80]